MTRLLLFLAVAPGVAVLLSGAFVWFYNRVLSDMHETVLKKVLALAGLPLGCIAGGAAGLLAAAGPGPALGGVLLAGSAGGALVTVRMAAGELRRRPLRRAVRPRRAGAGGGGVNRPYLSAPARVLMALMRPVNGATDLRIAEVDVPLAGLHPDLDGYRIVHITDLHIHPTLTDAWYQHVLETAGALAPDLLLFGGDFISKPRHIHRIPEFARRMHAPDGVWWVRGNHDFWKAPQRITRLARESGLRVLSNEGVVIRRGAGECALIGLESPYVPLTGSERDALEALPRPRIGLVHDPVAYRDAAALGCEFALAGHTHGGQVRLPLFGTTISGTGAGLGLSDGPADVDGMRVYTSNGAGAFFPFRIMCPPEIVVVTLKVKK